MPDEGLPLLLRSRPDRRTVYVTAGTSVARHGWLEAAILGARDLEVNVVATASRLDPAEFGPQPENVHIARYISQSLILPHAAVVVTHGGFSSVLGALANGLPMVILPRGADQPVNARRAEALGTAIVLNDQEPKPELIRAAVQKVLEEPAFRARARQVQAENDRLPGPDCAVALLEQLVDRSNR